MLHKKVVLAQLQIRCPKNPKAKRKTLVEQIAGQIRNHFYETSLPWTDGSLGRVLLIPDVEYFYLEHLRLSDEFYKAVDPKEKDRFGITLTILPFPALENFPADVPSELKVDLIAAPRILSGALEQRFERRVRMLLQALREEKRFYASHLSELEKVTNQGIYLDKDITPQLLGRIKAARASLLIYTVEEVRQSTSVKEDIISNCGALL
jgi:hypothetical protein